MSLHAAGGSGFRGLVGIFRRAWRRHSALQMPSCGMEPNRGKLRAATIPVGGYEIQIVSRPRSTAFGTGGAGIGRRVRPDPITSSHFS